MCLITRERTSHFRERTANQIARPRQRAPGTKTSSWSSTPSRMTTHTTLSALAFQPRRTVMMGQQEGRRHGIVLSEPGR
jgi:hypothetical protein